MASALLLLAPCAVASAAAAAAVYALGGSHLSRKEALLANRSAMRRSEGRSEADHEPKQASETLGLETCRLLRSPMNLCRVVRGRSHPRYVSTFRWYGHRRRMGHRRGVCGSAKVVVGIRYRPALAAAAKATARRPYNAHKWGAGVDENRRADNEKQYDKRRAE